jgi:outer membrane biosynthesis protein TonB
MASTEIPTVTPTGPEPDEDALQNMSEFELHEAPVVLLELQDARARSRLREALWLSLIVHLFVIIMIATSPHWAFPARGVIVMNPNNINQKDMTYLELPPDVQKLTEKPKTDILSDRDRIATSKSPSVNHQDLHRILNNGRTGPPGPVNPAPVSPPMQQQQMAQQAPPQQQNPANQANNGLQMPPSQNQAAKLESMPGGGSPSRNNPFAAAMSAGSSIDQAARATAGNRGVGSGAAGDYGTGLSRPGSAVQSNLDILSDTQGVDFGPYLERVLHTVRINWYNLIPEVARPPMMKKGKVSIEFAIQSNGQIAGMRLVGQAGDISLDRAAWGGITASNPFPPLPSEFHGSYLALRFHFFYNPAKGDMQ